MTISTRSVPEGMHTLTPHLVCAMCGRLRVGKRFVDFFAHCWSELPCVRPFNAAQNEAAGHNALRGSGPGQKPALEAPGA
jgi:hypothetical protein